MAARVPEGLALYAVSLAQASYDATNRTSLIASDVKVANFDGIKDKFAGKHRLKVKPCSADALFVDDDGMFVLAEFKNGEIDEMQIIEKLYDSAVILLDVKRQSPDWMIRNACFVLVYRDADENVRARHELMRLGSRKADDPTRFYIAQKAPHYLYKAVEEMTAEEFTSRYLA